MDKWHQGTERELPPHTCIHGHTDQVEAKISGSDAFHRNVLLGAAAHAGAAWQHQFVRSQQSAVSSSEQ